MSQNIKQNKVSQEFKIGTLMILGVVLLITGLNYLKGFNPLSQQMHLFSVYEKIEGWNEKTEKIKKWANLPNQAKKYINKIESLVELPIVIISTGPDREDTIILKNLYE